MDEIARYNRDRWEALAQAGVEYSIPYLDLTPETARQAVDPNGILPQIAGKDVLCLASGGGQQSAAFALLGASVTALDITPTQLERDRRAAAHYGLRVKTMQGDMRDLSALGADAFDVVWHGHSLNFVPDARQVFAQVARVLRPGGLYHLSCSNPFTHTLAKEDWDGHGYPLRHAYADGEVVYDDPHWDVAAPDGGVRRVVGPREFRHTLHKLINGMAAEGFVLLGVWETVSAEASPAPGSWEHFKSIAAPYLTFWARWGPLGMRAGE